MTEQWALFKLGLFSPKVAREADVRAQSVEKMAWDITEGSNEIIVCIIDSGIDYNHPDLIENLWVNTEEIPDNQIDDDGNGFVDDRFGYNFKAGSSQVMDGESVHWIREPNTSGLCILHII